MKVKMNPIANSMGTLRWISPRHRVRIQLYTFNAVGTAMINVVVAKKNPKYGFMPLTYMWWAQTTKLSAPISTIAQTIIR